MKTHFKRKLLLCCLIFLLIFRISTLRENVKYFYSSNTQSKNHALIEYEISTNSMAFAGKRVLDFKFIPSIIPNILKVICSCLLALIIIRFFYKPIFDLRRKISYLNVIYFNGGKYKTISSFN